MPRFTVTLTLAVLLAAFFSSVVRATALEPIPAASLFAMCFQSLRDLNRNALIPTQKYGQNAYRTLSTYKRLFLAEGEEVSDLSKALEAAAPGDHVLDVGAGLGFAMLDLSRRRPDLCAVAINAQDVSPFFARLRALAYAPDLADPEMLARWRVGGKIAGIKFDQIEGLYLALGQPLPDFVNRKPPPGYHDNLARIQDSLKALARDVDEATKRPSFKRHTDRAEDALADYKGKAGVIVDSFGAYYYGAERLLLVQRCYDALKDGGTALIMLPGSKGAKEYTEDMVLCRDGREMSLPAYLASKYPDVFTLKKGSEGWYLVVRKSSGTKAIEPRLETVNADYIHYDDSGFAIPGVSFHEKP